MTCTDRFLRLKLLIFTLCANARCSSSLFRFGRADTLTHTWNARLDSRWQKDNSHGERLLPSYRLNILEAHSTVDLFSETDTHTRGNNPYVVQSCMRVATNGAESHLILEAINVAASV